MDEFKQKRSKNSFSKKEVVDIGALMKMYLDKKNISDGMTFSTLKERFAEVVGQLLLPHVKPLSLEGGILVLKASNSAWRQELFLQKKAIIDKCNLVLGKPAIQDIRLT